jgi:hypothetical protein
MTSGVATLAVLGFAPLASAAAADTLTVAGGSTYTYTFNQSPSIQAIAQPNCQFLGSPGSATLTIDGPGVTASELVTHAGSCNKSVSLSPSAASVNTAHPGWDGGGVPADNGTYTVTLNNQGRTKSATFVLLIPPAKPTGFAAAPAGGTYATFSWSPNPEADITGYEVMDAAGQILTSPSNPCSAGTCLAGPVDVGDSAAGKTEKFSLVAIRSCGDAACNGGDLASTAADTATATFPGAPTPTPTPTKGHSGGGKTGSGSGAGAGSGTGTGTGSGSGAGSGAGAGAGGSSTNGGGAITLHGDGSSVNLGQTNGSGDVNNSLPPASSGDGSLTVHAPSLPGVPTTTLGSGGKVGKIHYPAPVLAKTSASQSIAHDLKSGLSLPPLWRGIAAAAVLVLIAVHLRAWVSRTDGGYDEPGARPLARPSEPPRPSASARPALYDQASAKPISRPTPPARPPVDRPFIERTF